MSLDLQQLAAVLQLEFEGDPVLVISGLASLDSADTGDLCFIQHKNYLRDLATSRCSAVIVPRELKDMVAGKALLIADNPHFSFIQAIEALGLEPAPAAVEIHPSAQIADSARIGCDVGIGALAVIGDDVEIGDSSSIGAGAIVGSSARVGAHCQLHAGVQLARGVSIGNRCIIQSGAVIGSDGFGLIRHRDQWHKVPQLGSVVIEDDVEIGANTTVDRGTLDDTIIGQGCKLDNQIQVAHNVRIGAHTAIAACVGIAGSATIGRYCKISGAAVILGHLSVADNVTITAMSLVTKDIRRAGIYSSGTPLMENSLWHRCNARYKSLDKLAQVIARFDKDSH